MTGKESSNKVQHNYHDHSHVSDAGMEVMTAESAARTEQNFPTKLHFALSEIERDGLGHIVSWQPHGRCFLVRDQKRFVKEILPLWFRQTRWPSFQRQLNLYGFKRLTTGRDKGAYYHECFLRGKRALAHRIERMKIKGEGARKPSSPETEPNFYLLPFLQPSPPEPNEATTNPSDSMAALAKNQTASPLGAPLATSQSIQRLLLSTAIADAAPAPMSFGNSSIVLDAQKAQLASQLRMHQDVVNNLFKLGANDGGVNPLTSASMAVAAAILRGRQEGWSL